MRTVALYIRVSTEEQSGERHVSMDTQEQDERQLAAREIPGANIPEHLIFRETHSGTDRNRPEWLRMIGCGINNEMTDVIVWNRSRWSRDDNEGERVYELFENLGIQVWSCANDMQDFLIRKVTGTLYEYESREKSKVVRRNLDTAAAKGKWYTGRPADGLRRERDGNLVAEEPMATIIRRLFQMIASGTSLGEIQRTFWAEGFGSKGNTKPYTFATLATYLQNPIYKGIVRRFDSALELPMKVAQNRRKERRQRWTDVQSEYVEPLVTPELWDTANAVYRSNHKARPKRDALTSGLVRCGVCGGFASRSKVNERDYIRCNGAHVHRSQRTCDSIWQIRADAVDAWFSCLLDNLQPDERLIDEMTAWLEAQQSTLDAASAKKLAELDRAVDRAEGQQIAAIKMLANPELSSLAKKGIERQLNQFSEALERAQKARDDYRPGQELAPIKATVSALRSLASGTSPYDIQYQLGRALFKNIIIRPTGERARMRQWKPEKMLAGAVDAYGIPVAFNEYLAEIGINISTERGEGLMTLGESDTFVASREAFPRLAQWATDYNRFWTEVDEATDLRRQPGFVLSDS